MKLYKSLASVILAIFLLTSCSYGNLPSSIAFSEEEKKELLQSIYEISSSTFDDTDTLNHSNVISDTAVLSIDDTVQTNITIRFLGEETNLTYSETIYYPDRGLTAHIYAFDKIEDCTILLKEDGSTVAISGTFATIDISPTESSDQIMSKLEPITQQFINPEKYEYVEVDPYSINDGPVLYYEFIYYNLYQGYRTDFASIIVTAEGEVGLVRILDSNISNTTWDIDENYEQALLELKLRSVFDNDHMSLVEYDLRERPKAYAYNGEPCIFYNFSVAYYDKNNDCECRTICKILVPVRIMTAE